MTRIGAVTVAFDASRPSWCLREVIEDGKVCIAGFRFEQNVLFGDLTIEPGRAYQPTSSRYRRVT